MNEIYIISCVFLSRKNRNNIVNEIYIISLQVLMKKHDLVSKTHRPKEFKTKIKDITNIDIYLMHLKAIMTISLI